MGQRARGTSWSPCARCGPSGSKWPHVSREAEEVLRGPEEAGDADLFPGAIFPLLGWPKTVAGSPH